MKTISLNDMLARLSPKERAKVAARADELIAAELKAVRKSVDKTQEEVAKELGITQESLSEFENRSDWRLSKLQSYISALGGKAEVVVTFPGGERFVLNLEPRTKHNDPRKATLAAPYKKSKMSPRKRAGG